VAFFFSSIAAEESKKYKKKKVDESESDSEADDDFLASSANQSLFESNSQVIKKKLRPVVWYWLAMTTPNGAPANPLSVLRSLLECGVEADAHQVSK